MFHVRLARHSHNSLALFSVLVALAAGCGGRSSAKSTDAGGTNSDAGNRDDAGSDSGVATSMDAGDAPSDAGGQGVDGGTSGDDAGSSSGGGDTCNMLCTDSGFASGTLMEFGGGLIECPCTGSGGNIPQAACDTFCKDFGVMPPNAILSGTTKCVCDGT